MNHHSHHLCLNLTYTYNFVHIIYIGSDQNKQRSQSFMRKQRSNFNSSLFLESSNEKESRLESLSQSIKYSEIPRAVVDERADSFFQPNTAKKSTFFDPSSSQVDYCQAYSPQKRSKNKLSMTQNQEKLWSFLANPNKTDQISSQTEEGSSIFLERTSKKLFSKQDNEPTYYQEENIHSHISEIQESRQETNIPGIRKEKEDKKKVFQIYSVLHHTIQPQRIQKSLIPMRHTNKGSRLRNIQEKEEQEQKIQLDFVELKEAEKRDNHYYRYPLRKTRILPLSFWIGEKLVLKKGIVVGKLIEKK